MHGNILGINYAVIYLVQLILSESIYFVKAKRQKYFIPIGVVCLGILGIIAFLIPNITILNWVHLTPLLLWLCTLVGAYVLFAISKKDLIFLGVAGLATQHIASLFGELALTWLESWTGEKIREGVYWGIIIAVIAMCYILFPKKLKKSQNIEIKSNSLVVIVGIVLVTMMFLRMIAVDNLINVDSEIIPIVVIDLYGIMAGFVILWILFSANQVNTLEMDNILINQMMKVEAEKHRFSESTIDMVNMKCHNLKYQIRAIRKDNSGEDMQTALKEVEKSILIYDKIATTGNPALDTILTEKNLYCNNYNIDLSYIVDGDVLNFMKSTDLYSLFGNILDNAIEAVGKEVDSKKRIVFLKVCKVGDCVSIHAENYCTDKVKFCDGIPVTSKKDDRYHGFGTKSIRYIVEQYNGNVVFREKHHMFYLDILFS